MPHWKAFFRGLLAVVFLAGLLAGLAAPGRRAEVKAAPAQQNTAALQQAVTATAMTASTALIFTATPTPATTREVLINEVAWAGTAAFTSDEWIELYNPGSAPVDLTGWRLTSSDGQLDIGLTGTIPANGFFLLEWGADDTVSDITADQIYPGPGVLSNSGTILKLIASDGTTIVDTANSYGGGWPAGSASGYYSMERKGVMPDSPAAWASNDGVTRNGHDANWDMVNPNTNLINGTPKSINSAALALTATVTPTATATPTCAPTSTALSILINEVAWAGTAASTSDEWIELYNPGCVDINLTGWKLRAYDGTPDISLSGEIPAGGYFLLERDNDNTVSDIISDGVPTGQIYTGELENTSETLLLYNSAGVRVDTANLDNNGYWPAGSTTSYRSMERRGVVADSSTAWVTNTGVVRNGKDANGNAINGTPKRKNWAATVTITPSPKPKTRTPTRVPTPVPRVVINEFLPRPGFDWNGDGAVDVYDEFIEIMNLGPIDVDLKGWTLDDEVNSGSQPFSLPSRKLKPGQYAVFYGSTSGILLSDGGDTVRLINPRGVVVDARTYLVALEPDQSHCRLPDGYGNWREDCFPTPGVANALRGAVPASTSNTNINKRSSCLLPDLTPDEFRLAECDAYGAGIWSRRYWDAAAQGDMPVQDDGSKWGTFVE